MKSGQTLILEGLRHISEYYNGDLGITFEDIPTTKDYRKLEKLLSQALTDKYTKVFSPFGSMGIDVDMYVSYDDDVFVDDVIKELNFNIIFDEDISSNARNIIRVIDKNMKAYPSFKYSKVDNSLWFSVEEYKDIIEIFDIFQKTERINLGRLYYVYTENEVENQYTEKTKEAKDERLYMERDFNRRRL